MKKTKHFVTVEKKNNVLSVTNAQLKMSYIKQQSDQYCTDKKFLTKI